MPTSDHLNGLGRLVNEASDRRSAARLEAFREVENRVLTNVLGDAREEHITWPGGVIRAMVAGHGTPTVFLHGISGTLSNFASLAGTLADDHRCVLVDLPGHGLSTPIDLNGSRPRPVLVNAIQEVIRQTAGDTPPVLVGNSLGGMIALYVAADRPGLVAGIAALGEPAFAFPGARARAPLNLLGTPRIGPLILRLPPPPMALYARAVQSAFGRDALERIGPDALDANRLATRAGGHAASVAGLMHNLTTPTGRARSDIPLRPHDYDDIDVPVWFLWGTDDPFMSIDTAKPWIERLPHASSDVVAGAHVPWFDAPQLARERIEALAQARPHPK